MKATKLLAISEATKNDLVELAHADATKIVVTPLAVNASDFTVTPEQKSEVLNRYRLSAGKYFLYVGRLETKKNVVTLLRAFAELKKDLGVGHPIELVLAGKWGYGEEAIKQTLAVNNNGVRVLGFTPEEDLASLYSGALAFCFPSLYEGFGMPVLEAAAAGTPVIASDIPALREVMGDAAVFCFAAPRCRVDGSNAENGVRVRAPCRVCGKGERTRCGVLVGGNGKEDVGSAVCLTS